MIVRKETATLIVEYNTMMAMAEMYINRHLVAGHTVKVDGIWADENDGSRFHISFVSGEGLKVQK